MEKKVYNYLAKVVAQNEEGKDVVQLYAMTMKDNTFSYEELKDIPPLDWDVAKKQFSVVGIIR